MQGQILQLRNQQRRGRKRRIQFKQLSKLKSIYQTHVAEKHLQISEEASRKMKIDNLMIQMQLYLVKNMRIM
jgi:hypothetical protein